MKFRSIEQKTSIQNYQKLREVQSFLSSQKPEERMNKRRALSRKCFPRLTTETGTPVLTSGQSARYSQGPFLVGEYNRTADGFQATSTVQPDEEFLGYQIRNGTMGPGDIVRGWHTWGKPTGYLEPNPKGREFPPIEVEIVDVKTEKLQPLTFDLFIAFTGKKQD